MGEIDAKSEAVGRQLAKKFIRYGQRQQKWLSIKYGMGKSGQKFLDLNKTSSPMETSDFPRILVPEDVFTFVRAMDELVNAVNRNRDRIEAKSNNTDQQVFVLHTAMAKGTTYDFELDLCLGQSLFVNMRSVPNERKPGHKPRFLRVPYRIFHWLRRAIGEVFVESGERTVQQQLGEPPRLPVWLNKDVFLM